VWKYCHGEEMSVNIASLGEYMEDFNIKLKKTAMKAYNEE